MDKNHLALICEESKKIFEILKIQNMGEYFFISSSENHKNDNAIGFTLFLYGGNYFEFHIAPDNKILISIYSGDEKTRTKAPNGEENKYVSENGLRKRYKEMMEYIDNCDKYVCCKNRMRYLFLKDEFE